MRRRLSLSAGVLWAAALLLCGPPTYAEGLTIVERTPHAVTARLPQADAGRLYQVTYDDGEHRFIWENLVSDEDGCVRLADDRHLRPEYRLRCESTTSPSDPVVFDDLLKGPVSGTRRVPFGVPVSTFGGPGYLVPGLSDLKRDDLGNCWLYMDREPYAILSYNSNLEYRLALLTPGPVLAHDLDADGDLYILHPGNWVSKHGPMGEALGAWELPFGRGPGEFVSASGLSIDRDGGLIYVADEKLGRVQRFDLALTLRPLPETAWGWIGREDLAYTEAGEYRRTIMYYQLDRPRQLCLDGKGHLFVSCEHYVTKIDLATGLQVDFGRNPVLGWGGSFTDSADSRAAALDGHWQRHWLAGVDSSGNVYISDRENEYVVDPRLQVFGPDGVVLHTFDLERGLRDASGAPVYLSAVRGMACSEDGIWLVDAAGRIYQSPPGGALRSGGRLRLGPGAAGRQFDLTQVSEERFHVAAQAGRVKHRAEGRLLAYRGDGGTRNCEREGTSVLEAGARSMWALARLGEPFEVTLFDEHGVRIPAGQYRIQFEEQAGLFGTRYDYFRVTNVSGKRWRDVRFVAETIE